MPTLSSLRINRQSQEGTSGLDSAGVLSLAGAGVDVYSTLDSLPMSNLTAGAKALVIDVSRLYLTDGNGWYNVQMSGGLTPYWDSGGEPDATYTISDSATPLIITARAADSDTTNLINQSFGSDSAQYMVSVTNDSSIFTFTPKSADSIGIEVGAGNLTDSNGDFIYTFKWSDGINFVSKAVTITYNVVSGGIWYGDRGLVIGGDQSSGDDIEYLDITTLGTTSTFGSMVLHRRIGAALSNSIRGLQLGGRAGSAPNESIDYVTISTPGNAADFGDLTIVLDQQEAACDGTTGLVIGGLRGSGTPSSDPDWASDKVEKLTVATTGNATLSSHSLIVGRKTFCTVNDGVNVLSAGGRENDGGTNTTIDAIEYMSFTNETTGTSFGTLTADRQWMTGAGNNTRGIMAGGFVGSSYLNNIEYVTMATPGNGVDFGNLSNNTGKGQGVANQTRFVHVGGYNRITAIEYVTIDTTGNASSFGTLTNGRDDGSGVSGDAA